MSKAVLEIDVPTSCAFCRFCKEELNGDPFMCVITGKIIRGCEHISGVPIVTDLTTSRHPDCPLVIEEEGLRCETCATKGG